MQKKLGIATIEDDHINVLSTCMMHGWQSTRAEVIKEVQLYWSFRDEIAVIVRIVMKSEE